MKNIIKKSFLIILFLSLLGCTSTSKKIDLLNQKLKTEFTEYSLINNCVHTDESGGDILYSVALLKNEYVLLESFYKNKELDYYKTYKLVNFYTFNNNIVVTETKDGYNNLKVIIVYNKDEYTHDSILKLIKEIVLQYGQRKIDLNYIDFNIYYSSELNNNLDFYKEFAVSQITTCNNDFFKEYKKKLNIINDFESYNISIYTEKYYSSKENTNSYNNYVKDEINNKLKDLNK